MTMIFELGEWLEAEEKRIEGRKTPIYIIRNIRTDTAIAEIKWWGGWRKYCFFPYEDMLFDDKCLKAILEFLNKLNKKGEKTNGKQCN